MCPVILLQDTKYGASPLMGAAANGHYAVVEFLLDRGADPTLRAHSGSNAYDFAKSKGHAGVARLLEGLRGVQDEITTW